VGTDTTSASFTLAKKAQSISWATIANFPITTAQQQLTASATSGLPITYALDASTTNSACTVTSSGVVTVTAIGDCVISAGQVGNSLWAAASDDSQTIPVVAVAPGVPAISSVSMSDGAVTVAFTPPASTGGSSITGYTITATDGATPPNTFTVTCNSSPCTLSGLTNNTAYTISITANNTAGSSPLSTPSCNASAVPVIKTDSSILLQIFATWPAPASPA